jgi:hypothetical protein
LSNNDLCCGKDVKESFLDTSHEKSFRYKILLFPEYEYEADSDMSGEDEADEDESDSYSNSILNALVDRVYTFAVKLAKQEPAKPSSLSHLRLFVRCLLRQNLMYVLCPASSESDMLNLHIKLIL